MINPDRSAGAAAARIRTPRPSWLRRLAAGLLLAGGLLAGTAGAAQAQIGKSLEQTKGAPVSKDQPVTFTADQVTYDRATGIVTATGNVDAWQGDHEVRADKVTFDRNTDVAAAIGHVVLLEPDGQVLFADYIELSQGMKDAVLRGMRAQLTQNGRLAANGARRTGGEINELSRLVYSTCNVCQKDPSKPPLWQIRAYSGVQDLEHKRIEFYDATVDAFGVPVVYLPYFNTPDPSVKRASGIMIPVVGQASTVGAFFGLPYYGVLDDQSDITVTPLLTTQQGGQIDADYRRQFNDGTMDINLSAGQLNGQLQGSIFANGAFSWDDTWRYGFTFDRASSVNYLNDYNLGNYFGGIADILTSNLYIEGFGTGSYSKLDTTFYQSLDTSIAQTTLPIVLPRYEYSYFGQVDPLGGRVSLDTEDFNVLRNVGTNTQRADLILNYARPFTGMFGDMWNLQFHLVNAAYNATAFDQQPNFGPVSHLTAARTMPQMALDLRWPFMRTSTDWGSQILEPEAEVVVGPNTGNHQMLHYPNEDSLDLEFTDANLFGWNRFPGIDLLEGGSRLNLAMHGAWYLNGTVVDALFGQSYSTEPLTMIPFSGLTGPVSDYVGHLTFAPSPFFNVSYRYRLDHNDFKTKMADVLTVIGKPVFNVNFGYVYTSNNPYTYYDQPPPGSSPLFYIPRNEATAGFDSRFGHYHFSAYVQRDLQTNQMVMLGAEAAWENECMILDTRFTRMYTEVNGFSGYEAVLFTITLKTIGAFGFHGA